MKLNTEPITASSPFWSRVEALAKEAFPPEEYLAPKELVQMAEDAQFDFLALTEEGRFVGFMAVQVHRSLSYLFFLAIASELRASGYGSGAIEALKERYPDKTQVVDFEMLDQGASNYGQRVKRKRFYLRNGYRETGLFLSYCGVDYEVMCMGEDFREDEFKELMKNIRVEGFEPRYFYR